MESGGESRGREEIERQLGGKTNQVDVDQCFSWGWAICLVGVGTVSYKDAALPAQSLTGIDNLARLQLEAYQGQLLILQHCSGTIRYLGNACVDGLRAS